MGEALTTADYLAAFLTTAMLLLAVVAAVSSLALLRGEAIDLERDRAERAAERATELARAQARLAPPPQAPRSYPDPPASRRTPAPTLPRIIRSRDPRRSRPT